ncbi:MAG: IS701 family transposase [Elioraea tepidiphila]
MWPRFVSDGAWDAAPLLEELVRKADDLLGGDDAVLLVDDTAPPKKGSASVGVAPQDASALGKQADCQTLVSLTPARGELPVTAGLRLFLTDSWTTDPARMRRAGVPPEFRAARAKPEIAIEEIDRLRAAGLRFGAAPADAGYGLSAPFRQALSARGLRWAFGIPCHRKVYPADVALIFPPRRTRAAAPASHPRPDVETSGGDARWCDLAADVLAPQHQGRAVGSLRGPRLRVADGPAQRIGELGNQHMPGEEVWLVGEQRASGERKFHLCNLPAGTPLRALAATIKARRIREQAHQKLQEELGRDHFEGRSWAGLQRHALMTMIACAFSQAQRLAAAKGEKPRPPGPPPEPSLPAVRRALQQHPFGPHSRRCPHCSRSLSAKFRHVLPR